MAKKKKKQKKQKSDPIELEQTDLGGQELITIEGQIYRLPDMKKMKMGLKHIYGEINSNLQKYYHKNLLCPQDSRINAMRFVAGEKLEALAVYSGLQSSQTFNWDRLEGVPMGNSLEIFNINGFDAHDQFTKAMQSIPLNLQSATYNLIVNDQPVGRRKGMENLKESLDCLRDFFKIG
jgi:hypothetical protein